MFTLPAIGTTKPAEEPCSTIIFHSKGLAFQSSLPSHGKLLLKRWSRRRSMWKHFCETGFISSSADFREWPFISFPCFSPYSTFSFGRRLLCQWRYIYQVALEFCTIWLVCLGIILADRERSAIGIF